MRSRILLLILAAVAIPACKSNQKLAAPVIIGSLPSTLASSGISVMPNILFEFDKEMDATDMSNAANFALIPGAASSGVLITVQFLPALNQVRIIPSQLLVAGTQYTVLVAGLVKSAAGTPLGSTSGFQFTTMNPTTTTSTVSWAGATAATGAGVAGDIDLVLQPAQESSGGLGLADVAATYNVYYSLTPGGENLIMAPLASSPGAPGAQTINLPQAATLYYLKIQPVDSSGAVFTGISSELTVTTK
jgi:hypothetical protein